MRVLQALLGLLLLGAGIFVGYWTVHNQFELNRTGGDMAVRGNLLLSSFLVLVGGYVSIASIGQDLDSRKGQDK
jgi:hypothetical protein